MRLLSRLRLSQGLGDSTLALPAFLTRALPGPRGTKCYRSHVIELSFKLRRSDMFTVHGGSGAFRSSGAKVVWLGHCVYKHPAPPEPGTFRWLRLGRA